MIKIDCADVFSDGFEQFILREQLNEGMHGALKSA